MTVDDKTRDPPEWLNSEYLTKALRVGLKHPSLEINSYRIQPATAVGENYASLMFRAELNIKKDPNEEPEDLSVVIKSMPPGTLMKDMIKKFKISIFEKEARMFLHVLPAIYKILKDAIPEQEPLSAECIWYGTEPDEIIILQDLKKLGFNNLDRHGGLDMEATKLTLETLAKYHAGTVAVHQRQPELLAELSDNLWVDNTDDAMNKMMTTGISSLIEEAADWPDFPPHYLQKLKDIKPTIFKRLEDSLKFDENAMNVFQHGDCWINNIMYDTQNRKIQRIRLVDFQIGCMNSAAMDLNYFIFTSPNASIRLSKIDEMLEIYYNSFMDTINKIGVQLPRPFTLEELKKDFKNRAFFGFMACIIVYPITITQSEDAMPVDDFFDDGKSKRAQYHHETFQKVFKMVFPYFVECGAF